MDELQRAIKNCKAMIAEMDFERVDGISALMVKCVKGKALETAISAMRELQEYRETGLTPAQIREIDKLYQEKCKELVAAKDALEKFQEPEWKRRMLRTFLGSRGGDIVGQEHPE